MNQPLLFVGRNHWTFLGDQISGSFVGDQPWQSLANLIQVYGNDAIALLLSPEWFVFLRCDRQEFPIPTEATSKLLGLAAGKWRFISQTLEDSHFIAAIKAEQFAKMTAISSQFPKISWNLVPLVLDPDSLPVRSWSSPDSSQNFTFDENAQVTQWYGQAPLSDEPSFHNWYFWLENLQVRHWLSFKSKPQQFFQKLDRWSALFKKATFAGIMITCLLWSIWMVLRFGFPITPVTPSPEQTLTQPEFTALQAEVTRAGQSLESWQQVSQKHHPRAILVTLLANETQGDIRWLQSSWDAHDFHLVFETSQMAKALAYADRLRSLPSVVHIHLESLDRGEKAKNARFRLSGSTL